MKTNNLTRYVAFLRGINVGGNNLIKMEELRRALAALRFKNVRTFIASGNVIFESGETKRELLAAQIERKVRKSFGHEALGQTRRNRVADRISCLRCQQLHHRNSVVHRRRVDGY